MWHVAVQMLVVEEVGAACKLRRHVMFEGGFALLQQLWCSIGVLFGDDDGGEQS
jgi:hypothetical protein